MTRPTDKLTPRRLEVLREVARFGTVAVVLRFGWRHTIEIYAVHSLTELKSCSGICRDMTKLGWLRRTWIENSLGRLPTFHVTEAGQKILEQHR